MSKKTKQVVEAPINEVQDTPINVDVEVPQIALSDLVTMVNVIDFAAKSGAFAGENISIVGDLRKKLVGFLEAVNPPTEDGANSADSSETAE